MSQADVLIIGAGLAGLSAARRLRQAGVSVLVLEARDRVGGRVHSVATGSAGGAIDLGAQFIGDAHTRVMALVREAGLTPVARSAEGRLVYQPTPDARPVLAQEGNLPLSWLGRLDALQVYWRLARHGNRLGTGKGAGLDDMSASTFLRRLAITDEAYCFLAGFLEGELCVPLETVSAQEALAQAASVGGHEGEANSAGWFLAEGAGALTRHLADTLGDVVRLNAPVHAIERVDEGVTVQSAAGSFAARHLIVATPPQLYGSKGLLPLLPEPRRAALAALRSGSVVKTVLVFDRPWWRDRGLSGSFISPGGLVNAGLGVADPVTGQGSLVVFATATSGQRLGKTRDESNRIAHVMAALNGIYGCAIPTPLAARSADWNAEPFSLGGYASRRGPGGWTTAPDLFAPIGPIHFAGTESATFWRSFMEGALETGEGAADAVLAAARAGPAVPEALGRAA